jgi:uncharacterized protein (DUF427 family)
MPVAKAVWEGAVLAESDDTVVADGNHYFSPDALQQEYFKWKGAARYYSIEVNGKVNQDAAWYYPETQEAAKELEGRIAFWRGVEVEE